MKMKIIDLDDAVVAGDGDDSDYQTILFNRPPLLIRSFSPFIISCSDDIMKLLNAWYYVFKIG